tara:strand:- start:344 stop:625 length:282 start_codon:yes stop_codon:yes gene_type:complete
MTYDYHCEKCNVQSEETHPIADRDLPTDRPCLQCGAHSVKRGIAAPFFSYEGNKTLEQRARAGAGSDFVDIMKSIRKRHPAKAKDGTKQTVHY